MKITAVSTFFGDKLLETRVTEFRGEFRGEG